MENPTPNQIEDYCQNLIKKLENENPDFELNVEYGKMLMRHIDSFTPDERKRYDELTSILSKKV